MLRFIAPFLAALSLAAPLHAACLGQDLRPTLTPDQSATLEDMRAGRPFQEGNHWLAEKDGKALHLIGTVHLDDPRLDAPADRLRPLIEGASLVLLEMTAPDQADLQVQLAADPGLIVLQDSSLPELMSDEDWEKLSDAARARGLPPFMVAKWQPWYVSTLLGMPACMPLKEAALAQGVDKRIEKMADAAGVPTAGLEPVQTALRVFADMPLDQQVDMLVSSILPAELSDNIFATLMAAYLDEHHVESWLVVMALTAHLGSGDPESDAALLRHFEEQLLDGRNESWIPVLEQALADSDGPVVAAFGAAHLGGTNGVLNLLAQKGYALSRQPF